MTVNKLYLGSLPADYSKYIVLLMCSFISLFCYINRREILEWDIVPTAGLTKLCQSLILINRTATVRCFRAL